MGVVRIAHTHDGLQAAEDAHFVLRKEVVGVGLFAQDVVALADEAFAYVPGAGGELIGVRETEDATKCAVRVAGALARLGVGFGLGRLPVVIVGAEEVGMDVQIDVRAAIGGPTHTSAIGEGLVVEVIGVGGARGIGIDFLAGGGVFG